MPIITTISLPSLINQRFDPYLFLDYLDKSKRRLETKIKPLANKKLRDIDIGRKREFEVLLTRFERAYERKKIEKAEYHAEIEEKAKKRPYIPT